MSEEIEFKFSRIVNFTTLYSAKSTVREAVLSVFARCFELHNMLTFPATNFALFITALFVTWITKRNQVQSPTFTVSLIFNPEHYHWYVTTHSPSPKGG